MPKSNRMSGRRGSGTVTVIETRVHRNSARRARAAFIVTTLLVTAIASIVLQQWLHSILALLAGIAIGLLVGAVVWCAVRVWPIVRVLWWWLPELAVATVMFYGWDQLNRLPLPAALIILGLLLASLAFGAVRRRVTAYVWCFIVRHRLRTCFAQFIIANQSGSLPLILVARPTPVGERVWIYLRPGLSPADLESRLEKIAVACHASAVVVERASTRTAGYVRVDVKRREVLGGMVGSPLPDETSVATVTPLFPVSPAPAGDPTWSRPQGLDDTIPEPEKPAPVAALLPRPTPAPSVPIKKVSTTVNGSGEDLSDWID